MKFAANLKEKYLEIKESRHLTMYISHWAIGC